MINLSPTNGRALFYLMQPIYFNAFREFELKLSYDLNSPGINWVMGDNGAGKSTLLKVLCGVVPHTLNPYFQKFRLGASNNSFLSAGTGYFGHLSLEDHFKLKGLARNISWNHSLYWLRHWHLESLFKKKFNQLSVGQRSRALLALYTLGSPEYLVIDEPEHGLDDLGKSLLAQSVNQWRYQKRTVIISTHVAPGISKNDWITLLSEGRLQFQGTVEALLSVNQLHPCSAVIYLKRLFKKA